jgi:SHS2 domain-containing protein
VIGERFYRIIEHTADIRIEVEAPDVPGIFTRSALAMLDLMFGFESVGRKETRTITTTGDGVEELLIAWLNEVLYVYSVEGIVFSRFSHVEMTDKSFSAVGSGERLDCTKLSGGLEIKAATYHGLSIRPADGGWKATIIFDV